MTVRNIKKNLAGAEDLLHGIGTESQARGGALYQMHKLDTYVPTYSVVEMQRSSLTFMRLYGDDTNYTDYRRNPSGTVGIPSEVEGVWEPIPSDKTQVVGNFLYGAYVYEVGQVVAYNNNFYAWNGAVPNIVPAASSPATAGGIGIGAWTDKTDLMLRSELSSSSGAELIGETRGGTIQDAIDQRTYVTAKTFPFLAKGDFSRSSGTGTDDTASLLAYRDYCLANGTPFILPATPSDKGYLCLKRLDLTNIHVIRATGTQILTRSTLFDHSLGDWLVTIGNPLTTASDITGLYDIDRLQCEDLDFRASALNGIYIKASALIAPFVRALKFNGSGISCAPLWDSNVYMITEHCGNLSSFALSFTGNGDDNNACNIAGLVHDSYHKGLYVSGSKNLLERFHVERTYVLASNDGTTGLPSGDTYLNHEINLTTGSVGVFDVNDYDSSTSGYSGIASDGTTATLNLPSCIKIRGYATNFSQINAQKSNVNFMQGSVGAEYSSVSMIKCNNLYVGASSRITFVNARVLSSLSNQDSASIFKSGRCSTLARQAGKLIDFIINNVVNTNETTAPTFTRCTFSGGITRLASSGFALLENCGATDVTITNAGERQIWRGGQFANYSASVNHDIFFNGTRITGTYTVSGVTAGGTRTLNGTRVEGTVTGWATPVASGVVGEKTTRMGAIATGGTGIDYHCVAASTWLAVTSRA